ncbi:hypothetical protein ACJX0J_000411, partial [Zea mays]
CDQLFENQPLDIISPVEIHPSMDTIATLEDLFLKTTRQALANVLDGLNAHTLRDPVRCASLRLASSCLTGQFASIARIKAMLDKLITISEQLQRTYSNFEVARKQDEQSTAEIKQMTENMSHIILGKKPLSYVAQSQIYAPRNSDAANPVIINRELKIGELDNSTRGWRSQPTISGICFYPYAPSKHPEQAFTLGNRMMSHGLGWENYDIEYIPIPSGYAEWGTIILAKHSFNLRGDGKVDGEFYEEYVPSHHEREPSMLSYPKCLSQLLE